MYPLKKYEPNETDSPVVLRMANYSQMNHTVELQSIEGYSTMSTDGYQSFMVLPNSNFYWIPFNQSPVRLMRQQARTVFPFADKFYFIDYAKHERNVIKKVQFGG